MMNFTDFLSKYYALTKQEEAQLTSALEYKRYLKGTLISTTGDVCKNILFVSEGSARSFFVSEDGQEYIWNFHINHPHSSFENYFIVDYHSFLTGTPSHLSFEALTDLSVVCLSKTVLGQLLEVSAPMQKVAEIMTQNAYQNAHQRAFSLLTKNATQRYGEVLENEPWLLNAFPNYLVAGYIGIAPQSLSRIRKSIDL